MPYLCFSFYGSILIFGIAARTIITGRGFWVLTLIGLTSFWGSLIGVGYSVLIQEATMFVHYVGHTRLIPGLDVGVSLSLSKLSYAFLVLVATIGVAAHVYCLNYFKNEADEFSFSFWLNSFVWSMSLLLFSNNFWTLFLGWELIGLTSFFLINFWATRRATLKASFKAFTFNLISDLFLLGACVLFVLASGCNDITVFVQLSAQHFENSANYIWWGVFLLFLSASIKSVQLIGHLWLPDSMEAPVPASALIHSATLVSAGVFLLMRFWDLFICTQLSSIVLWVGAVTACYGSLIAALQTDVKRLLAYSTMSHCGFLFVCVYFNYFYLTISYLFLHGLFKASTFFCAGSFIRIFNTQDTRVMGNGARLAYFDSVLLVISAINLGGLPLSIGYAYKLIIFQLIHAQPVPLVIFGCLFLGLIFSLIYTFQLIYYAVFDYYKGEHSGLPLYLQLNKVTFIEFYRSTTPAHFIAQFIIYLCILFFYFTLQCFADAAVSALSTEELVTNIMSLTLFMPLEVGASLILFYSVYLIIIYFLLWIDIRLHSFKFYTVYFSIVVLLLCIFIWFFNCTL